MGIMIIMMVAMLALMPGTMGLTSGPHGAQQPPAPVAAEAPPAQQPPPAPQ